MDVDTGEVAQEDLESSRRRVLAGLLPRMRPMTHVYEVLGGSWRATCWCGDTAAVDGERAGWAWVFAHNCDE
jgi:hypothetical protein